MGKKKDKQKPDVDYGDDTASMLAVLATLDEVEAVVQTAQDVDSGVVPSWCEVRLKIKREASDDIGGDFPMRVDLPLRRHDGELIIQVLWDVLHPNMPSSAGEQIWDGLDTVVDRIQKRVAKGKAPKGEDVGAARALATVLAILDKPLDPDVDAVREVAMARYELRR